MVLKEGFQFYRLLPQLSSTERRTTFWPTLVSSKIILMQPEVKVLLLLVVVAGLGVVSLP